MNVLVFLWQIYIEIFYPNILHFCVAWKSDLSTCVLLSQWSCSTWMTSFGSFLIWTLRNLLGIWLSFWLIELGPWRLRLNVKSAVCPPGFKMVNVTLVPSSLLDLKEQGLKYAHVLADQSSPPWTGRFAPFSPQTHRGSNVEEEVFTEF